VAGRRTFRRRLTRPIRRLRRLTRLQVIIVVAMVVSVVGGATALTLVLRGPGAAPAYKASAPPLALISGAPGATGASAQASTTPTTVRLIIPSGNIDIAVIQGDGVTVPLHLAVHYPGTDQPGGGSNALYYAHAQPGMFQGLYQLHAGDAIEAVRSDGTILHYKAATFEKVPYNDRAVLNSTPFDQITLLTCTSYDPYTPRYIVIGLRV
jgi:LPXTG-site transpeptidase (sortase) family protein